jgi:hypothetical protein
MQQLLSHFPSSSITDAERSKIGASPRGYLDGMKKITSVKYTNIIVEPKNYPPNTRSSNRNIKENVTLLHRKRAQPKHKKTEKSHTKTKR